MGAMADWYTKAQETEQNIRLARILDVSQDLKALSILLNGQPLIFNIDLACLAARRGYLKLDKWMSDRIRDHGELFISTVVLFLRRKVPQLSGAKEDQMRPIVQMPLLPETVQTILKCISASTSINLNQELTQEIFQMNLQAKLLLDKPNLILQQQQQLKQGQNSLIGGNQGTFDMLQSMMNNLNMTSQNTTNPNSNYSNSPNKMLMSQLSQPVGTTTAAMHQSGISRLNSPQINLSNTRYIICFILPFY